MCTRYVSISLPDALPCMMIGRVPAGRCVRGVIRLGLPIRGYRSTGDDAQLVSIVQARLRR